jgi:hypothetical protein
VHPYFERTIFPLRIFTEPDARGANGHPLSIEGVLRSVWSLFRDSAMPEDATKFNQAQASEVIKAYIRRYETFGDKRVKRVDFLLDNYIFRGLTPVNGSDSWENVQLIFSKGIL